MAKAMDVAPFEDLPASPERGVLLPPTFLKSMEQFVKQIQFEDNAKLAI